MAGTSTDLIYQQNQGVLVTIRADFDDFLGVPRGFTFVPDLRARAGPVDRLAVFKGQFEGFRVHVSQHKRFSGGRIDGHGGDETVFIEFRGKIRGFLDLGFVSAFGKWIG